MDLLIPALAVVVLVVVVVAAVMYGRRDTGPRTDFARDAKLATAEELGDTVRRSSLGSDGVLDRIIVGFDPMNPDSLVLAAPYQPVLVVGATGSGKTASLIIPNILVWSGGLLTTSVKTELAEVTIEWRSRFGEVAILDAGGTIAPGSPLHRHVRPWTPLTACRSWPQAASIAQTMVAATRERVSGGQDAFWDTLSALLLPVLMWEHANRPDGSTMGAVLTDLTALTATEDVAEAFKDLTERVVATRERLHRSGHTPDNAATVLTDEHLTELAARFFVGLSDRTSSSVVASVVSTVKAYLVNPTIASVHTHDPRIITPELLLNRGTIYVIGTTGQQDLYKPVYSAFVESMFDAAEQAAEANGGTVPVPLLMALDELPNVAPIRKLVEYAATVRSRKIQMLTSVQDLSQLHARYGEHGASSVLSNHTSRLLLPFIGDLMTLEWGSRIAGEHRVTLTSKQTGTSTGKSDSHTDGGGGRGRLSKSRTTTESVTESEQYRPVASPERIASIEAGELFAILRSRRGLLSQWLGFAEPILQQRSRHLRPRQGHDGIPVHRAPATRQTAGPGLEQARTGRAAFCDTTTSEAGF